MQRALEEKLELRKTVHIGTHEEAVAEGNVLNRIIRRTEAGWEMEADMRHGELLVQQLGGSTSRKITTPGADSEKQPHAIDDEKKELE